MEAEKNISGISENLADSIVEQKAIGKKEFVKSFLHGKRIAISVSENEELEQLGLSDQHLKDISIEIARYLIVNGATMLYGGDLRDKGYTRIFSELSYQYKFLSDKERRFVNYFPFPNYLKVSMDDRANFVKQQVEPKIISIPKHLGNVDTERKFEPFKSVEDRFIYSECFADMRIIMANESDARILLGGKQKKYLGYFPGIIEEAFQTLQANKPIYLLGGFGGAAKSLIKVILGERPNELSNEFQFDTDFLIDFRDYCKGKSTINLDFVYLVDYFQQHTVESISKSNGLSIEENLILFESTNIHELVFLIIKGLQNIANK
jgi:SLOG cluster2